MVLGVRALVLFVSSVVLVTAGTATVARPPTPKTRAPTTALLTREPTTGSRPTASTPGRTLAPTYPNDLYRPGSIPDLRPVLPFTNLGKGITMRPTVTRSGGWRTMGSNLPVLSLKVSSTTSLAYTPQIDSVAKTIADNYCVTVKAVLKVTNMECSYSLSTTRSADRQQRQQVNVETTGTIYSTPDDPTPLPSPDPQQLAQVQQQTQAKNDQSLEGTGIITSTTPVQQETGFIGVDDTLQPTTASPTKSPTATPTTLSPTAPTTRGPTQAGETFAPTLSPTKKPTPESKSPTVVGGTFRPTWRPTTQTDKPTGRPTTVTLAPTPALLIRGGGARGEACDPAICLSCAGGLTLDDCDTETFGEGGCQVGHQCLFDTCYSTLFSSYCGRCSESIRCEDGLTCIEAEGYGASYCV